MWWRWRALNADDFRDEDKQFNYGWGYTSPGTNGQPAGIYRKGEYATKEIGDTYLRRTSMASLLLAADIFLLGGAGSALGIASYWLVAGVCSVFPLGLLIRANRKKNQATEREEKRQAELARRSGVGSSVWYPELDNDFAARFCRRNKEHLWPARHLAHPPSTGSLCHRCESLLGGSSQFLSQDILASGAACNLCTILYDRIKALRGRLARAGYLDLREGSIYLDQRMQLVDVLVDPRGVAEYPKLQIGLPMLPHLDDIGGGESVLTRLLKTWLAECDKHCPGKCGDDCDDHHHCMVRPESKSLAATDFVPTRLIDTQFRGSASLLGLVEAHRAFSHDYIVLSHRWGKDTASASTVKANYQTRKTRGFPLASLPQTFQDAVAVTRQLGKRYIWIDSLCLIQDDDVDKHLELPRMEHVFASAYCTIAATEGTDGFLSRTHAPIATSINTSTSQIYVTPAALDASFETAVNHGLLNSRAWVLQERALSRRTIHFTERHVYWECGEHVRRDDFSKLMCAPGTDFFLQDPHFPLRLYSSGVSRAGGFLQGLFAEYSQRGITEPRDRHLALLGLTTRMQRCLAAHWEEGSGGAGSGQFGMFGFHLARLLLWRRKGYQLGPKINYAGGGGGGIAPPSWSWMAYPGGIEFMVDGGGDDDRRSSKTKKLKVALHEDLQLLWGDASGQKITVKVRSPIGQRYKVERWSDSHTASGWRHRVLLSQEGEGGGGWEEAGEMWPDQEDDRGFGGVVVVGHDAEVEMGQSKDAMVHVIFVREVSRSAIMRSPTYARVGVGILRADMVYGYGETGTLM